MKPSPFPEDGLLQRLLDDQQERFQRGEPLSVESYLQQYPELRSRTEDLLTLIYDEIVKREQRDELPRLEEYAVRFPSLERELREQFEMHAFVKATEPEANAADLTPNPVRRTTAEENPPPPVIEGYEVLGELGVGGMGIVYKARQVALKRLVALKMIKTGGDAEPEELFRFRMEAEAVARLQHPHIVQIHELGEHEGQPFFALELVEGSDLRKKLTTGVMPAREAAALLETLARAVHAAHLRGLVHRDLKPDNVLLTADGTPKITDFGLARHLDRSQSAPVSGEPAQPIQQDMSSGKLIGTLPYMAPEQVRGRNGEVGPATDVYALGVILYEALTGRPPFTGANWLETSHQIVNERPVPPRHLHPEVSLDLEAICLKCLEKEAPNRYTSAEKLADDLGRFQRGEPVDANPVGRLARLGKWVKRKPVLAGWVAAAVLTLVTGTAVSSIFAVLKAHEADRARKAEDEERQALIKATKHLQHSLRLTREFVLDRAYPERMVVPHLRKDILLEQPSNMLDEVLAELDALQREESESAEAQFALAVAHLVRADTDLAKGLPEKIEGHLRSAKSLFERLEEQKKPNLSRYASFNLGVTCRALGERALEAGRPKQEARQYLTAARGRLRKELVQSRNHLDDNGLEELARATVALAQAAEPAAGPSAEDLSDWLSEVAKNLYRRLPARGVQLDERGRKVYVHLAEGPYWPRFIPLGRGSREIEQKKLDEAPDEASAQAFQPRRHALCFAFLRARQTQARLYESRNERVKAIVLMKDTWKALDRWPDTLESNEVLEGRNKLEQQLKAANALPRPQPGEKIDGSGETGALLDKAQDLLGQGKPAEAIEVYRNAIRSKPKLAWLNQELGDMLMREGRFAESVTAFRKAVEHDPSLVWAHAQLGRALIASATPAEAETALHKVVEIAEVYDELCERNELETASLEAAAAYRKLLEFDPRFARAHHHLGVLLKVQWQHKEAAACLKRALELMPEKDPLRLKAQEALKECEKAMAQRRGAEEKRDEDRSP